MKLKFLLNGLHPASPQYPSHLCPYILREESLTEKDKEIFSTELERNLDLIAFAADSVSEGMWRKYKLKKL